MTDGTIRQVLAGQKALVVGIANDQSIAYGCAKAFRTLGAGLAVTWLNERARRIAPGWRRRNDHRRYHGAWCRLIAVPPYHAAP
jgi:hypothetical protein